MTHKIALICTLGILTSAVGGAYLGGQINVIIQKQKCEKHIWGINHLCQAWVTPGAMWQGSTTGLWMGTALGAVVASLATRQKANR
ncbi:MAG: hypothetical protein VKL59_22625 [Nostocaceae cyanobacterium]|nr:hypothetical protein [Nostocaceae cyanobacterium]